MTEFYSQASSSDEAQGYRGDEISDCYEQPVVSYQLGNEYGLGSDISDETHQQIIRHAADETKLVMTNGNDLVAMVDAQLAKSAEPTGAHTDMLQGSHHEAAVVMNQRTGTTLDRQALAREFDRTHAHHQAFNIDTWAFAPSAEALYPGDPTAQQHATTAMLYYNLAAIMALCGPHMTVTVLE